MRKTFNLPTILNQLSALTLAALLITGTILTAHAQTNCRYSLLPCSCVAPAPGMVGWWPGDNTAEDIQGGNHGTLQNGASFTAKGGKVGSAFIFDGIDDFVSVPASPGLNVGTGNGFTIEAWVNTDNITGWQPLVEWNNGTAYGTHLWLNVTSGGVTGSGGIYANIVDTNGGHHDVGSGFQRHLQPGAYHHVALTFNKNTGEAQLFLDGTPEGTPGDFDNITPQTSYDLYLGRRPGGGAPITQFSGMMDEVSIYDHTLSPEDIAAIYRAAGAGKCRYSVSGRITDECGNALRGVSVEVKPLGGVSTRSTLTDGQGYYNLSDLPAGGSYTVTPQVPVGSLGKFVPPDSTFINLSTNQTAVFYFRPMLPGKCQSPRPIVYISDLDWVGTPINAYQPVHRDVSVGNGDGRGNPITLNGVGYGKGLGVHSYSEVVYDLDGQYSSFVSDIGLDDEADGSVGSVVFIVVADGVELYRSGVMRHDTATQTINVSVASVQELKLIVTIADNGDTADHADWANTRLVR